MNRVQRRASLDVAVLLGIATALLPVGAAAQDDLCVEAERFLREAMAMEALAEPDTIDDWRTRERVAGCRITAAGATSENSAETARRFFRVLHGSPWTRTPEPMDAPNEASLRYRRLGADCLFSYYDHTSALGTRAEFAVSEAVRPAPGQRLFYMLVLCTPEAPAAARISGGPPAR